MGYILFLAVLIYGIILKTKGNSWEKTLLSCLILFVISRLCALIFQLTPAFIFKEVPQNLLLVTAALIPSIIYIVIPIILLR